MQKALLFRIAAFSCGLTAAFVAGTWAQSQGRIVWHWPESMEAVRAAPKNHRVLFENDHIRLLEVTVQPGETENMHGHLWPSVFAIDAVQPKLTNHLLEGGTRNTTRAYEDADWSEPICRTLAVQAPHQISVTDTFPLHFYRLEFKKMDGKGIESKAAY
jgi:hypothetical protein